MSPKQKRFVTEYLIDLNATQAAIRAGYSEKTSYSQGQRMLKNVEVQEALSTAQNKTATKLEITKERIVAELAKIAFADIRKAVRWGTSPIDTTSANADPNGLGVYPVEFVPSETIEDDIAAAVSEVSLTQTGVKIKMHDKKSALVDLAKMLGFMVEKHDHTSSDGSMTPKPTTIRIIAADDGSDDTATAKAGTDIQ